MSESIDDELQQIVESALHPVRASAARKAAMREELLGHVSEAFAEELAHATDERAALAATRRRFGATTEIGPQLKQSVPFVERWFLISEKELLMSKNFWLAAVAAIAIGPAIILPAMAKYRDEQIFQAFPFALGGAILLAGIVAAGYGVVRHFARQA